MNVTVKCDLLIMGAKILGGPFTDFYIINKENISSWRDIYSISRSIMYKDYQD
jgi:hypothetical protein